MSAPRFRDLAEACQARRASNLRSPTLGWVPSGDRSRSAIDEGTEHQVARCPQSPIHRMSARQKGHDRHSASSEFRNRVMDRRVARIDHLAPSKVSQRLGSTPKLEIDAREVQVEIGIEELLFGCGFTERPRFREVAQTVGNRQP